MAICRFFSLWMFGSIFLLAISSGPCLTAQETDNEKFVQDFFNEVASGKTAGLIEKMDPRLQALVDEPVLTMLFACINEKLGSLQSFEITKADTDGEAADGTKVLTIEGKAAMEKGDADVRLSIVDGKYSGFNVKSEKIANWLKQPADTTVYEQGSKRFMELFLEDSGDTAWAMLHPSLREAVPRDKFQEMIDRVAGVNGKLKDASLAGVRWEAGEAPAMYLDFRLVCDNTDKATCEMKIQFAGLQGHITGFHFKDK